MPCADPSLFGQASSLLFGEDLFMLPENKKEQLVLHYMPKRGRSFSDVVADYNAGQVWLQSCAVYPLILSCLWTCTGCTVEGGPCMLEGCSGPVMMGSLAQHNFAAA